MRAFHVFLLVVCTVCVASLGGQGLSAPRPESVFLEDLTWMEVRDAVAAGKTTVIIPTGGTEQNGPHMALGKHNYLVTYKAGEIAKRLGNALVAPTVAYVPEGDINPPTGHMRFAGTITLPQEVFGKLLEWAATGVRVHHISAYYPGRGDDWVVSQGVSAEDVGSHAGTHDTSSLMYLNPSMLRFDRMGPGKAGDGQGHVGNPAKATALFGKRILEMQIEDGTRQIQELRVSSRRWSRRQGPGDPQNSTFDRASWATLHQSTPLTRSDDDLRQLRGLHAGPHRAVEQMQLRRLRDAQAVG